MAPNDWVLPMEAEPRDIIIAASHRAGRFLKGVSTSWDLRQDAYIIVATRPDEFREVLAQGHGKAVVWLSNKVLDANRRDYDNAKAIVPWDELESDYR